MTFRVYPLMLLLAAAAKMAGADCLQPQPASSQVVFVASQAGAPFEGAFRNFSGHICLDPASPETGNINIIIDTAAVDTGMPEFDDTLRGAEFFNTARWPTAQFISTGIKFIGPGKYSVAGHFTLRDITREIEVPFAMTAAPDGGMQLTGETQIKRLDYDIGLGEWRDTRWVGDAVVLRFDVKLSAEQKAGVEASAPTPAVSTH